MFRKLLISAIFLYYSALHAQRFDIESFRVESGLPHNYIFDIKQDSLGFLWIATANGLSRFDGREFDNLSTKDGLADNHIASILIDSQNQLWAGHRNGLISRINLKTMQIDTLHLLPRSEQGSGLICFNLAENEDRVVFAHIFRRGLFAITEDSVYHLDQSRLLSSKNWGLQAGPGNLIWLSGARGLNKISFSNHHFTVDSVVAFGDILNPWLSAITMHSSGLWIGTINGKVFRLQPGSARPELIYSEKNGLPGRTIHHIAFNHSNEIFFSVQEQGLFRAHIDSCANEGSGFSRVDRSNGLPSDIITCFMEDREQNYWIGTDVSGLMRFRDNSLILYDNLDVLEDNAVWSLAEDGQGSLWLGSDRGLIRLGHESCAPARPELFNNIDGQKISSVASLFIDQSGDIWATRNRNGLLRIPAGSDQPVNFDHPQVNRLFCTSLAEDSHGQLWLGTFHQGIHLLNRERRILTPFEPFNSKYIDIILYFEMVGDRVYISTETNGLFYVENDSLHSLNKEIQNALKNIIDIKYDRSGDELLILNDESQIFCLKNDILTELTAGTEINATLHSLIRLDKDNIILGTSRGLALFDINAKRMTLYGYREGFPVSDLNDRAVLRDSRGMVWFGSSKGLLRLQPDQFFENKKPAPVYIREILVNYLPIKISPGFELNYLENHLSIDFRSILFQAPGQVTYSYFLEGLDNRWSRPSAETRAVFNNLKPGDYTFYLKSQTGRNEWAEKPTALSFHIRAPFWQTTWFYSVLILLFGTGVYSFHQLRLRMVTRQNLHLEETVTRRTNDLQIEKLNVEQAYKALEASEIRFRKLTTLAGIAIGMHRAGKILYLNPSGLKITGYNEHEITRQNLYDLIQPDFQEILHNYNQSANLTPDQTTQIELQMIRKDGVVCWVEYSARQVDFHGGPVILFTLTDITGRRNLESNLHRLGRAVETSPVGLLLMGKTGQINYANASARRMLDLGPITKNNPVFFWSFLQENEKSGFQEKLLSHLQSDNYLLDEIKIKPVSANPFIAEAYSTLVQGRSSGQDEILIHFQNIQERKDNEEFLKLSEASFRGLFNSIPDAIYVQDRSGKFIDVNRGAEKMYGMEHHEFIGQTPAIVAADGLVDLEKTKQALENCFAGNTIFFEWWGKRKNGEIFPKDVILTKSTYFGEDVALAIARDITQRKLDQKNLIDEKDRLTTTLRCISDGVITTDRDGHILLMSLSAEEITGYKLEEAAGKPITSIVRLKSGNNLLPAMDLIKNKISGGIYALQPRESENYDLIIDLRIAPLTGDSGADVQGYVFAFNNITAQRFMEEELLKAQKLESVGLLAGGIAHDFNNILTAILGNISLSRLLLPESDRVQTKLSEAEKATLRARDLTQQLLTFAKGGSPVRSSTDIREVITDSAGFVLSGSAVKIHYQFDENLWPANVDAGQISQVIQNLVINAQQAMPDGGNIEVEVRNLQIKKKAVIPLKPAKYILIQIRDHGCGIRPENLPKIFDPYFTTKSTGSGLGLATTYSIIKRHDGYIDVRSTLNKGTEFFIYLPTSNQHKTRHTVPARMIEAAVHGGTILLMDDEDLVRETAGSMLNQLGYEVIAFPDGKLLLDFFAEAENDQPIAAIIMDLTVPGGFGGQETITELRKMGIKIPVIVSSGYSTDAVMAQYEEFGFNACLQKPFSLTDLENILQSVNA